MILRKFYFSSTCTKNKLFTAYCSNMYLCFLWVKCRKSIFDSVKTAYNNAFRIIHSYNFRCSASGMFVSNKVLSFYEMYRKNIWNFSRRLSNDFNSIILAIANSDMYNFSLLTKRWEQVLYV